MKTSPDTLIILSPAFPPNESAEESPWLPAKQMLINAINRNFPSVEVVILSLQYPAEECEYTWHGNKVISLGGRNKRGIFKLKVWLKAWRSLRKLRRKNNIIGLLSFWCNECCLVGSYFGKIHRLKHLCWISGQDAKQNNRLVKYIRPIPGELVAMSEFLSLEFYKNHKIKPTYIIPNAIDVKMFITNESKRTIDVIGAGSLIPLKQYHVFVKIVKLLKEQFPNINAVICGDGPEKKMLSEMINEYTLNENLHLTDLISHIGVLNYMKQSKILLHPSSYEGCSNVCMEALYSGAHVISFTRAWMTDIEHWHVVETEEEMLTKAIELLKTKNLAHNPILTHDMNDSAKSFINLFIG